MPHHPSLNEIIKNSCLDEWAEFSMVNFSWAVWISSDTDVNAFSSPEYTAVP